MITIATQRIDDLTKDYEELSHKTHELENFLFIEPQQETDERKRHLLKWQLASMKLYLGILRERLEVMK